MGQIDTTTLVNSNNIDAVTAINNTLKLQSNGLYFYRHIAEALQIAEAKTKLMITTNKEDQAIKKALSVVFEGDYCKCTTVVLNEQQGKNYTKAALDKNKCKRICKRLWAYLNQ